MEGTSEGSSTSYPSDGLKVFSYCCAETDSSIQYHCNAPIQHMYKIVLLKSTFICLSAVGALFN